ncbi:MAG: hypothetical protein HYU66_14315, partial [Armatimonadetes bacterium]|nr:hypothetical protein [Armatimonadota bacterium]
SRWDGFSADLGPDGEVVRLKSDNGFSTEASQPQLAALALGRTGFFLGNGGNCLRSQSRLPIHRFVEGGNGFWRMCDGHLSPVPLVLGNFGDETTLRGVFEAVKDCLSVGCVYSPMAVNLLLTERDNFVCKLYPLTVREIGPGWVVGEERVVTTVSRKFEWSPKGGKARLWTYGPDGQRAGEAAEIAVEGAVSVTVPAGGMVILEGA